ncbi:MAG: PilN domain-containing protein [Gammaproteobacteria bacterium]
MKSNLLTADIDLNKFFHWWIQELAALIPPQLRSFIGAEKKLLLLLQYHDEQVFFFEKTDEGERPVGNFSLDAEGIKQLERFLAEHPERADCEKILLLHKGQALVRRITLPAATEANLRQVIAYEMNRYTPFNEQELYYDVYVADKNKVANQITVELLASPKDTLNNLYRTLQDWGVAVHAVGYAGMANSRCNLLPVELRPKIDAGPKIVRNVLASSLLVLLLCDLVLPLWMKSRYLEELQDQTAIAAKKVKEIDKIKAEAQLLLDDVGKLSAEKRDEPSMIKALNELTNLLPKDTWLNSFQYAKHKVQIQGLSASASALIGILERSAYFKKVSFISPVIPDRQSGQDRFQIAMEVAVDATEAPTGKKTEK